MLKDIAFFEEGDVAVVLFLQWISYDWGYLNGVWILYRFDFDLTVIWGEKRLLELIEPGANIPIGDYFITLHIFVDTECSLYTFDKLSHLLRV